MFSFEVYQQRFRLNVGMLKFLSTMFAFWLLVCFSTLYQTVAAQDTIYVWPNCTTAAADLGNETECTEIDQALKQLQMLTSNVTLMLQPGIHIIHEHYTVSNIKNLSIIGAQDRETDVFITCDPEYGLAFLNVSGLEMKGLTVQSCGLSGEQNLFSVWQQLKETKDLVSNFISIPINTTIALFLALCEDVYLERVTVTNTTGLGLLGINIIGNSSLNEVIFTHNTHEASSCKQGVPRFPFELDDAGQIGGGAYVLYLDQISLQESGTNNHYLSINSSNFQFNSECTYAAPNQFKFQYFFEGLEETTYPVGAGGGLSIFMAQLNYSIEVNIHASNFSNNDARYGSGVYLAFFLGVQDSGVRFSKCAFERNGLSSNLRSYSDGGAGMAVFTDVLRPNDSLTSNEMNSATRNIFVELTNTNFTDNSARVQGGGLMTYSQYNTQTIPASLGTSNVYTNFTFTNCVFSGNRARYGAAAFMKQRVLQGIDGGVGIWMKNVRFIQNSAPESILTQSDGDRLYSDSSALDIQNIQLYFNGDIHISHNAVTGISIHSSTVEVRPQTIVNIAENRGILGGGIRFSGSYPAIIFNINFQMIFSHNIATTAGGGIHFSPSATSGDPLDVINNSDCFLFPSTELCPTIDEICQYQLLTANATLRFENNKAPLGSHLYGSTLESCVWLDRLTSLRNETNSSISLLEFVNQTFEVGVVFNDDNTPIDAELLSTPPVELNVFVADDNHPNREDFELFPGETINVNTAVFDSFEHRIPSVVTARVLNENASATARLGASGFWFVDQHREKTPLTVTSVENESISILFSTFDASATSELNFQIQSCPLGFVFNNATSSCACYEGLLDTPIGCDLERLRLIVPDDMWIGPASDDSNTNGGLVVRRCVRRYCTNNTVFRPPNFDEQCDSNLNRRGVLCGACKDNYSIAFGAQVRCKKCNNYYLFTILVFIVGGILLFLTIALFGITIDKGWINMVLFYSNIVYVYNFVRAGNLYLQIMSLPFAFLSLKTEIDECLYDGMTSLVAAGLSFTFPLYLFLLMGILTLLVRCSRWLANHFSPISTFVTLAFLSYVSILENCILILSVTRLQRLDGGILYRWAVDPNQAYFSGGHIFLVILAVLFLTIYIIPLPLVLLRPSIAYRFFGKLKPFIDAFYAPFKEKYRFWFSLRLIIRGALFIAPNFSSPSESFATTAIILTCLTHIQILVKPYKEKWQNILDSTLMVDIIILSVGGLFYIQRKSESVDLIISSFGYTVLVGGAYIVFIYIFIKHLQMKYRIFKKPLKKFTQKLRSKSDTHASTSQPEDLNGVASSAKANSDAEFTSEVDYDSYDTQGNQCQQVKPVSAVTHAELRVATSHTKFTAYRESILEEFELKSVTN